jgi:hypothetical protein
MPKYLLVFLLISSQQICAQKTIASIKVGSKELRKFQGFYTGDTLFVTYEETKTIGSNVRRFFYVYPNGVSENFILKEFSDGVFCGFENINNKLYHYFVEKDNNGDVVLKAFCFDYSLGVQSVIKEEIRFANKVIGFFNIDGIQILCRNEKRNSIISLKVRGMKLVMKEESSLSEKFSFVNMKDFRVIGSTAGWIEDANSKVKIYSKNGKIIIVLDYQSGTDIIFFDENFRELKSMTIPEPTDHYCNSFLYDSLFRLSVFENGISIKIYSISDGSLLDRFAYYLEDAKKIDDRSGGQKELSNADKIRALSKSIKIGATPTIIVNKSLRGEYNITAGFYYRDNRLQFNPLFAILNYYGNYLDVKAEEHLFEAPSISRYLNASYDAGRIDFNRKVPIVYNEIDRAILNKRRELKYKNILVKSVSEAYIIAQNIKLNTIEVIKLLE